MVVNYGEAGWQIITQRAHGLLAAQLAMHWNKKQRPERWTETVLAIAEHDDAEVELDGENLLTMNGTPLNFDMKSFELEHCQKLSALALTKSRYVSLLTSMHIDFLYRKDAHKINGAAHFLKQQSKYRAQLRKELAIKKSTAEEIYCLMEWFDACSLLLCQQKIPPEKRMVEISHGPDGIKYMLFQPDKKSLSVSPWPFEQNRFTVNFESRTLTEPKFPDSAAFRKAFIATKVKETSWIFRKTSLVIKPKTKTI